MTLPPMIWRERISTGCVQGQGGAHLSIPPDDAALHPRYEGLQEPGGDCAAVDGLYLEEHLAIGRFKYDSIEKFISRL
jgi:hypothetical protein